MNNDEKVKAMYYEMENLQKQAKAIQEQIQNLNNKEVEINYIKDSLNDIKNVKKNSEILVPINNGIFIKAKIDDSREILVNVGSDVVVQKSVEETHEMMDRQMTELVKIQQKADIDFNEVSKRISAIENEFSTLKSE